MASGSLNANKKIITAAGSVPNTYIAGYIVRFEFFFTCTHIETVDNVRKHDNNIIFLLKLCIIMIYHLTGNSSCIVMRQYNNTTEYYNTVHFGPNVYRRSILIHLNKCKGLYRLYYNIQWMM